MARIRMTAGLALATAMLMVSAGSAEGAASPGGYSFHDCTGPAGTPMSFTAVKEQLPAAEGGTASGAVAFRLTDGGGVFVALQFGSSTLGPGIPAAQLTTTCLVNFAPPAGTLSVSGFIAPS